MGWLGAAAAGSIPALVTFFSFSSLLLLLFLSSLSKPIFLLSTRSHARRKIRRGRHRTHSQANGFLQNRQWERTLTGELKLTAVGRREVKREVVVSITRKPKNLVAPRDGIGKSPALWTGNGELRQDPPPLDLSFWSFLTFLHHGIEEVERHLLWKFYKQIRRKSWSNVPPKLLACIGFLYKVVHKIGRLRKFNRSREIEFNFLTAWTISMKFGTLVQHAPGYKTVASDFLIFAWGLSYGLSKSKKWGKIVTKLWKRS